MIALLAAPHHIRIHYLLRICASTHSFSICMVLLLSIMNGKRRNAVLVVVVGVVGGAGGGAGGAGRIGGAGAAAAAEAAAAMAVAV